MDEKIILALATPEDREDDYTGFVVDPGALYPSMAAYATAVFNGETSTALTYHLALTPYKDRIGELVKPINQITTLEQLQAREYVMETLRQWFTRMLKNSLDGEPLGLHITRDLDWRLTPTAAQLAG